MLPDIEDSVWRLMIFVWGCLAETTNVSAPLYGNAIDRASGLTTNRSGQKVRHTHTDTAHTDTLRQTEVSRVTWALPWVSGRGNTRGYHADGERENENDRGDGGLA